MNILEWINDIKNLNTIKEENKELNQKIKTLGIDSYEESKKRVEENENIIKEKENEIRKKEEVIELKNNNINQKEKELIELDDKIGKKNKQLNSTINKISKNKELYKSIEYSIKNYLNSDVHLKDYSIGEYKESEIEELCPSIITKLNAMNVPDLKKAYRENEKQIDKLLELYSNRYTTKANRSIYDLMVIALKAELQNILNDLKYNKLTDSIDKLKTVTSKYLKIAGDGNQSILPTLTKFIGEVEYLFINSIKIEYNYYVKKEQAKQEQQEIREKMKQEAEERKALEIERKKVEQEEQKYKNELNKINEDMKNSQDDAEIEKLKAKILELQSKLSDVAIKKNDIINLQNGKAGTVYIISNLGAFGENVFKIGMTRRIDPQDRVNELGDASVPFKFDVHSFIFSEDAVALESKLHEILNFKRLNKVNRRKEFFKISIEELEQLVRKIDPTAEFNMTMMANEYRESLSSDVIYTDDAIIEITDEE